MTSNMKPSMADVLEKPKQENVNPRGEKRTADGTIKEQIEQVRPVGQTTRRDTPAELIPNFLGDHNPDGQDRELSEFSGGYETEGEFGADEMEDDDDDEDDDEDEDENGGEGKEKDEDGEGEDNERRPERDFDPSNSSGNNGDGGDDGYEGDTDDSGAHSDFNFGDCESDGDPVFELDSEGEARNLDSVDPRTFGDIVFDTVESHMQTRVWIPDEDSQALIENETEGHSLFQDDAFQYPREGSSASDNMYYYDPDDLYYEESPEELSEESDEDMEGSRDQEDEEPEVEVEEIENQDEVESELEEAAAASPSDDTQSHNNDGMEYDYDTTYPHPIATEDMNLWYTDPILVDIDGHHSSDQPISGHNGVVPHQMATAYIQPSGHNREGIWEDTSEDECDHLMTPIVMELFDMPSPVPVTEEEDKENKYPQSDNLNMESEVENGILEEAVPEPASSNSQPWIGRYSPVEDREYRPLSFGSALRPVPSLAGRIPVLNVNPNSPRTQVHDWYSRFGTYIQDVPEERIPTAGVVRRAYSPPPSN